MSYVERQLQVLQILCENKEPSWRLFIEAILPFELYYSRYCFVSVEGTWLIHDLKRYNVIDFTHYWTAFHWIGYKLYENECRCYKFSCKECNRHWWEIFCLYENDCRCYKFSCQECNNRNWWEIFCQSNYLFGIYCTMFSPYGVLRSNLKRELSQSVLKLVYSFGYTDEEYTTMDTYTINQLKTQLRANGCVRSFRRMNKYDMVSTYLWIKKNNVWAFNTFAIQSKREGLFDDCVLTHIRGFV